MMGKGKEVMEPQRHAKDIQLAESRAGGLHGSERQRAGRKVPSDFWMPTV